MAPHALDCNGAKAQMWIGFPWTAIAASLSASLWVGWAFSAATRLADALGKVGSEATEQGGRPIDDIAVRRYQPL